MRITAVLVTALAATAFGCASPADQGASKGDQKLKSRHSSMPAFT